jgi:hypothetical protein
MQYVAFASPRCTICHGRAVSGQAHCRCVTCRVVRDCFRRYRELRFQVDRNPTVCMVWGRGWSLPGVEYIADVDILARRCLSPRARRLVWQAHVQQVAIGKREHHALKDAEHSLGRELLRLGMEGSITGRKLNIRPEFHPNGALKQKTFAYVAA